MNDDLSMTFRREAQRPRRHTDVDSPTGLTALTVGITLVVLAAFGLIMTTVYASMSYLTEGL